MLGNFSFCSDGVIVGNCNAYVALSGGLRTAAMLRMVEMVMQVIFSEGEQKQAFLHRFSAKRCSLVRKAGSLPRVRRRGSTMSIKEVRY